MSSAGKHYMQVGISLFSFYSPIFSFWQLFFLTYYAQDFAQSFDILLD